MIMINLSHATKLALLQSKFHRLTKYQMIKALKPFELSTVEWIILGYLDSISDSVPLCTVSKEVGIHDSFIAVLAAKLEERKLVVIKPDDIDKRKKNIAITKQGRKLIELTQTNFVKFFAPLLRGLSGEDIKHFTSVIKKILENFEKMDTK